MYDLNIRVYERYICVNKPLVADIMSSWLSEACVNLVLLPASSHPHPPVPCPLPSAPVLHPCPYKPLIHWSWVRGGVYTEILSMRRLPPQRTQNRLLTATCMWVCLTKMWTDEWQDHPVPEDDPKLSCFTGFFNPSLCIIQNVFSC